MIPKFGLKTILLTAGVLASWRIFRDRLVYFGLSKGLILYAVLFACSIAALIAASLIKGRLPRYFCALMLAGATFVGVSFSYAASTDWTYFDFITLVDARSASVDVSKMYTHSLVIGVVAGLFILLGIGLKPKKQLKSSLSLTWVLPPAFAFSLSGMLFLRDGEGVGGLPPAWSGFSYMSLYAYENLQGRGGKRQAVILQRVSKPLTRDIILIVDESVAGQYLDTGSSTGVRSGLVDPVNRKVQIFNYGLATSITNCSMGSNVTLRFGGTRNEYQNIISTMPSIWNYAHAAGLKTVHIYAQRGNRNQNYMTNAEREDIDHSILLGNVPDIDRDQRVADILANFVNNEIPEFILVNKMGSHFPVNTSYPKTHSQYHPVLPRSRAWRHGDDSRGNRLSIIADQRDWVPYRNSYRNTLTWTVGAFFDRLFLKTSLDQATIIYTSDHGQTFHERGGSGLTTHCQSSPEIEEGIVPLVVIEGQKTSGVDWTIARKKNHNGMSHFRIFPTLLHLMGYDRQEISATYGYDLLSSRPDPFTFAAELHLRLGRKPKWIKVPLDQLRYPDLRDIKTVQINRAETLPHLLGDD